MRDPRDVLVMWTITYDTADFPGRYVVRGFDITPQGPRPHEGPIYVGPSLVEARSMVPVGSWRQVRDPADDPVIVESWF